MLCSLLCSYLFTSECCHSSQMNFLGSIHDESYTQNINLSEDGKKSVKKWMQKLLCEKLNTEIILSWNRWLCTDHIDMMTHTCWGKVMFSQVFVCPQGRGSAYRVGLLRGSAYNGSLAKVVCLQGALHPEGSVGSIHPSGMLSCLFYELGAKMYLCITSLMITCVICNINGFLSLTWILMFLELVLEY